MQELKEQNVTKPKKKMLKMSSVRVSHEAYKKATVLLKKINQKQLGRRVKFDQLLLHLLEKFSEQDCKKLQEESLSNSDKLEKKYREYTDKNGPIKKEEFYAFLLEKLN